MYRIYRCVYNSEEFFPGQGIAIIQKSDGTELGKGIIPILNSKLMDYLCKRYIFNLHNKPSNLQLDATSFTPIKDYPSKEFSILYDYAYTSKNLNDKLFKEVSKIVDLIVYELYLGNELKTKLTKIIMPYVEDNSTLKLNSEKLKVIGKFIEQTKKPEIQREIEKIKSHHWIKVIEGN